MTERLELTARQNEKAASNITTFLLAVAVLALSLAAIFIRLSEQEISPVATVFHRFWIATIVFGFWSGLEGKVGGKLAEERTGKNWLYTRRDLMLLLTMGTVASLSVVFWAWSLTQTSVANSTVLRNLTPLFTTLGGWLFFQKCFDRRFLTGMALALAGAITIGIDDLQISTDNLFGDGAALLAALLYGFYLLVVEQLRLKFSASTILLWRCGLGAVLTFPIVLLAEDRRFPMTLQGWLAVISLAVICQCLGQGLLAQTLNQLSSGFVAVALLLEPAITALLAWAIFSEGLSLSNGLAWVVVLVGIYLAKTSSSTQKT
ncbi:DMT family transporter [Microseira wollei]|uniref:Conserved hypothetical membrane protein n=1 Tax=Microseira wollei NIES-4236 TaxID=2530354 RepID=A0AAV3X127_9CYAN|nr:DMT family transporter [Microseira wollei]GET35858.1 conserved hypothetical membrane protein [Microseira wollei NIES-4236]